MTRSSALAPNGSDDRHRGPLSRFLGLHPHTKVLRASAMIVYPSEEYSNYGFIAVLGLAQQLKIDVVPIIWQAPLSPIGRGGQGEINQALVNVQSSFAFKLFDHSRTDPFGESVQEIVVLGHPLLRNHLHIVRLLGIRSDIPKDNQV